MPREGAAAILYVVRDKLLIDALSILQPPLHRLKD
jgi:hypothetical protein